jgi:hypothetical protein
MRVRLADVGLDLAPEVVDQPIQHRPATALAN